MDKEEEERLIKAYERKLWGEEEEPKSGDEDDLENPKTPSGKTPAPSGTPNKKTPAAASPNFKTLAANAP